MHVLFCLTQNFYGLKVRIPNKHFDEISHPEKTKIMKYLRLILLLICILGTTVQSQAQKEIFIKQIDFRLDEISDIDYENEYFVTLKLNKGTKYVFKITNHIEDYVGEAVVELMDADNLILTNSSPGKYYEKAGFVCNKTGFYDLLVKFKDNKTGNSVVDVVMVQ